MSSPSKAASPRKKKRDATTPLEKLKWQHIIRTANKAMKGREFNAARGTYSLSRTVSSMSVPDGVHKTVRVENIPKPARKPGEKAEDEEGSDEDSDDGKKKGKKGKKDKKSKKDKKEKGDKKDKKDKKEKVGAICPGSNSRFAHSCDSLCDRRRKKTRNPTRRTRRTKRRRRRRRRRRRSSSQ